MALFTGFSATEGTYVIKRSSHGGVSRRRPGPRHRRAAGADAGTADPTHPGPVYRTVTDKSGKLSLQTFGRPDGRDMVFRISGAVYANIEGNAYDPQLRARPETVQRRGLQHPAAVPGARDHQLYQLSREIVFYTDPADPTRILREWKNPMDLQDVPVVPINNDAVNFGPFNVTSSYAGPPLRQMHDETVWTSDIPVRTDFSSTRWASRSAW